MVHLIIADGLALRRRGVSHVLEEQADFEVVGEATEASQARALVAALRPEIAILDASLPPVPVLELSRQLRSAAPNLEVLVLCTAIDEYFAADVLASGARGILARDDGPEDLVAAVRALAHHTPFTGFTARRRLKTLTAPGTSQRALAQGTLTSRERVVVQLIAQGLRTREIAHQLGISVKTVEAHRSAIFRKLGIQSLAQVVHYAVRNAMIDV